MICIAFYESIVMNSHFLPEPIITLAHQHIIILKEIAHSKHQAITPDITIRKFQGIVIGLWCSGVDESVTVKNGEVK